MLERRDELVLKLRSVDGCATASGAGRIATLDHEALDDAMEDHVVVFARLGQGGKVLTCL